MITKIKLLRVQIDGLAQLVTVLYKPADPMKNANWVIYSTKEVEHCHDSLILAKAWLGKILGELGEQTPYKNDGKRTDVNSIEPTADTKAYFDNQIPPKVENEELIERNHIEKVDWLRQEIDKVLSNQLSMEDYTPEEQHLKEAPATGKECWYETKYQECLIEARFWLGFELQRIRETELTK